MYEQPGQVFPPKDLPRALHPIRFGFFLFPVICSISIA